MKDKNFINTVENIREDDSRFAYGAYEFVCDAVTYTVNKFKDKQSDRVGSHISGYELLCGICDFAVLQFGPLAYDVLKSWGLENAISIGYVVFNMVDYGLLGKSDKDSIHDFEIEFDLKKELEKTFLPSEGFKPSQIIPIDSSDRNKV